MQLDIVLDKGVLMKDHDVTGFSALAGKQETETFLLIDNLEKNYYAVEKSSEPVKVRLRAG